ncbi:DUF3995 domain-containing protein [Nocardioides sp. zg-1228]|uniref:DUF3995 domain-containing protein n=1 Tax=Nocardioides sp. zg-1228 TaxID=2763008 RepID=UPI001642B301|nr:DUF3995 domain-containing protein [Nocardioides sp. zg-1228]MBC2933029.1 DUF3995 domain-containing protein [Nocardioides sp. zg-1228]QSF56777.1 DUF3995 domain-containing protein [Nocardioides sp. zg-1228]
MTRKPIATPAGSGAAPQPVDERAARTAHGALALWALLFAAPHLYWAFGGRGGLGAESGAADAALGTTWFSAYNWGVTVASVLGALLCGWLALRPRTHVPGWRRVLQVTAVLLLVRGAIGLLSLLLLVPDGPMPPYLLVAVEPWFVIGGLLCAHAARTAGPARAGRRPRPSTDTG